MRKIFTLVSALMLALTFSVSTPAPVSAHPVTALCGQNVRIRVVVFDHSNFTGAWDDYCSTPQVGFQSKEPSFAANDLAGSTDIGDMNNMNDKVSAVSLQNIGGLAYCVTFFYNTNFTGVSFTELLNGFEHDHFGPNLFDNDQWSSIKMRRLEDGVCLNSH